MTNQKNVSDVSIHAVATGGVVDSDKAQAHDSIGCQNAKNVAATTVRSPLAGRTGEVWIRQLFNPEVGVESQIPVLMFARELRTRPTRAGKATFAAHPFRSVEAS